MILDEASFSDIPALCELLALLFEQELEFQPDIHKQTAALKVLVGNPQRGRVFVLRDGDTLAGMVSVQALVTQGEMWLGCEGRTQHLTEGSTFALALGLPHTERYGPDGATYWVARKNS